MLRHFRLHDFNWFYDHWPHCQVICLNDNPIWKPYKRFKLLHPVNHYARWPMLCPETDSNGFNHCLDGAVPRLAHSLQESEPPYCTYPLNKAPLAPMQHPTIIKIEKIGKRKFNQIIKAIDPNPIKTKTVKSIDLKRSGIAGFDNSRDFKIWCQETFKSSIKGGKIKLVPFPRESDPYKAKEWKPCKDDTHGYLGKPPEGLHVYPLIPKNLRYEHSSSCNYYGHIGLNGYHQTGYEVGYSATGSHAARKHPRDKKEIYLCHWVYVAKGIPYQGVQYPIGKEFSTQQWAPSTSDLARSDRSKRAKKIDPIYKMVTIPHMKIEGLDRRYYDRAWRQTNRLKLLPGMKLNPVIKQKFSISYGPDEELPWPIYTADGMFERSPPEGPLQALSDHIKGLVIKVRRCSFTGQIREITIPQSPLESSMWSPRCTDCTYEGLNLSGVCSESLGTIGQWGRLLSCLCGARQ